MNVSPYRGILTIGGSTLVYVLLVMPAPTLPPVRHTIRGDDERVTSVGS